MGQYAVARQTDSWPHKRTIANIIKYVQRQPPNCTYKRIGTETNQTTCGTPTPMCQTKSMTGTHKQTRTKDQCCYDMQSERQPTTMNHQIEQRLHSNDMSGLVTRLAPSLTGAINHRDQDAHFTFLNRPTIKLTLKNCGQESRDSVVADTT